MSEELKEIADQANDKEFDNRSHGGRDNDALDLSNLDKVSALSQEDLHSEEDNDSASQKSAALSIQGVDQGFELSLTGMDLKNLAFLTKFMT